MGLANDSFVSTVNRRPWIEIIHALTIGAQDAGEG